MRSVVVNHIDHHLHASFMRMLDQLCEVLLGAIFRVHVPVISDRIGTPQAAFFIHNANWMDWHEPEHVYPQRMQARQILLNIAKSAIRAMISHINFINYEIAVAGGCITRHGVVLYVQDDRTTLL